MDDGAQRPIMEIADADAGAGAGAGVGAGAGGHRLVSPAAPTGMMENIQATLSHSGRLIYYNIFCNVFKVTAKYKPLILPVGKGANGVVWFFFGPTSPC